MPSLLPDNYWDTLATPEAPVAPTTPTPTAQPVSKFASMTPTTKTSQLLNQAGAITPVPTVSKTLFGNEPTKIQIVGDISPEEQIKKYGGVVGSPEYYKTISQEGAKPVPGAPITAKGMIAGFQAPHQTNLELAKAVGLNLPTGEDWDRMSTADKLASVQVESTKAITKGVLALPKTVATMVASLGLTAVKPFMNMITGKPWDAKSMETGEITKLPLLGDVPTYYESIEQARQAGMGPKMAYVFAGSDLVLKSAAMLPITEALVNTFKPKPYVRGTISGELPGKTLNTEPIKYAQQADGSFARASEGSVHEYYTMPKTESVKFGGNTTNIKWKMSPGEEGTQVISVVKNVPNKVGTFVKTEFGLKQVTKGDFGNEIKIYSAPVKTGVIPKPIEAAGPTEKQLLTEHLSLDNRIMRNTNSSISNDIRLMQESNLPQITGKRLKDAMFIDSQTKVLNRRFYDEAGLADRPQVSIDLRGLGELNKVHGTKAADDVLAKVGELLNKHFPNRGIRSGGDEFNIDTHGLSIEDLKTDGKAFTDELRSLMFKSTGEGVNQAGIDFGNVEVVVGWGKNKSISDKLAQDNKILAKTQGVNNGFDSIDPGVYNVSNERSTILQKGKTGEVRPGESSVPTGNGARDFEVGSKGPTSNVGPYEQNSGKKQGVPGQSAGSNNLDKPVFIIPEARKGLELRPITQSQLDNLKAIGNMKQMDPAVRDSVVKTLTGKETIGELTEGEYVRVAQTLAKFGEKYGVMDKTLGPQDWIQSIVSPPRHYFSYLEDTYGYPVNSQIYQPMERAQQLVKTLDASIQPELDGIFGKYSSPKMIEERRLIDAYVRGDTNAIHANNTLDPVVKTELIDIADKLKAWDNQYGEVLGVGKEAYLANYGGPKITKLGGVVPQYKNLDVTPSKEFFAKFKREGSLDPYIDDPYASRQIYIKEGAKALHYKPVLENFEAMKESLPPTIFKQANSYVQEKLGKLGGLEKFLDSFVPKLNKKFGLELPADATRQAISYGLSSMYSGLVGTPSAIFKQLFQLPTFVYSRLGTRFAKEALIKATDPAQRARVAKLGYLNEIAQPYGAELAQDFNPASAAGKLFKGYTQATVKPMTYVDNDIRIKTFLQAEDQWNDALNLYKDGKIQWNNLESKLDFNAFSKSNRNIIRQKLIDGDEAGAFDVYMRDIIDETSFPYRTGSGAKAGYGMAGKLATGLLNYTIESTNVLTKWMTSGQWEKIIRFAGNAKIIDETMKDEFGFDFGDTLYQKFLGITSPVVGLVGSVYGYFKGIIDNNRTDMNANASDIIRTLQSGMPSGIVAKNATNFKKSINAGVDSEGKYAIYDTYGKLVRNGDFTDLFWGTLMGFPTVEKISERNLYTDIRNTQVEEAEIKSKVNQLLREGKYDEMEKLINKTGVQPSDNAMESMYTPRLQKSFESLSGEKQIQFAPAVYK